MEAMNQSQHGSGRRPAGGKRWRSSARFRWLVATSVIVPGLIASVAGAGNSDPLPQVFQAGDEQPDGKIVTAGVARQGEDLLNVVSRFTADGRPDPDFGGGDGHVVIEHTGFPALQGVALAPEGRIYLGVDPAPAAPPRALYRVLSNGTLDPSFGTGGAASAPDFEVHHVSVAPDGRPLLAGAARRETAGGAEWFMAVARFDLNGELDPSFDGDGIAILPPGEAAVS